MDLSGAKYLIQNSFTKRYLFQTGSPIKGNRMDEGGWLKAPKVVGTDFNYYGRGYWKFIPKGDDKYLIENIYTKRYLFSTGNQVKGIPGDEGGWLHSPDVVGTDFNYYNRGLWHVIP